MLQRLKRILKSTLARFGFELRRTSGVRITFADALKQLTDAGFSPRTVIDVGVAYGTLELYDAFPDARLILVEALEEWEPVLKQFEAERAAEYVVAAAGPECGSIDITVPRVLSWASTLGGRDELTVPPVLDWQSTAGGRDDEQWREVPMITLDGLREEKGLEGPFVLKIDVEGAEPFVLAGARGLLKDCDVVACEITPDANYWGVHDLMEEYGFMLHDVYGQQYRPSDGTLVQLDMMFVKADGPLRKGAYYLPEQQGRVDSIVESLTGFESENLRGRGENR